MHAMHADPTASYTRHLSTTDFGIHRGPWHQWPVDNNRWFYERKIEQIENPDSKINNCDENEFKENKKT